MAIRAIAYHESVAMERLEKYFDGESGSLAGSTSTKCDGCDTIFAVVLPPATIQTTLDTFGSSRG